MDEIDSQYLLNNHQYFLMPMKSNYNDGMFIWLSICSKHQGHNAECELCQAGSWNKVTFDD